MIKRVAPDLIPPLFISTTQFSAKARVFFVARLLQMNVACERYFYL